jgi:hypothetical protein
MDKFGHYTEGHLRDEIEKLVLGVIESRERKYTPDDVALLTAELSSRLIILDELLQ